MSGELHPFLLSPVYQDYIWGGDAFRYHLKRDLPPGAWAESWEVSTHPDGLSMIETGPLAGLSLADALNQYGQALLGTLADPSRGFPLLIKVLDAARDLSIQVHPNEASARAFGGEPKTEMWVILQSTPGAKIYRGWKEGFQREAYDAMLAHGQSLASMTRPIPTSPGDVVYIPGGLVHAIGAGNLILEVQQKSNTTFRIDDWGRLDAQGKPRILHTREAAQHLAWDRPSPDKVIPEHLADACGHRIDLLLRSPFFEIRRLSHAQPTAEYPATPETFRVCFVADDASMQLTWPGGKLIVPGWRSVLIPAQSPPLTVTAPPGTVILETRLPAIPSA